MSYPAHSTRSVAAHLAHFDLLYALDGDPWRAETHRNEQLKRRCVAYALGSAAMANGLELGCGNGVSTCALARRFLRLVAMDGSSGAVALAVQRMSAFPRVKVVHNVLPCTLPHGRFDAIIASEVLYYLPRSHLSMVLRTTWLALRRGGLFVSTHHLRRFRDAECTHATLLRETRAVFGRERRNVTGRGWRCYTYVRL